MEVLRAAYCSQVLSYISSTKEDGLKINDQRKVVAYKSLVIVVVRIFNKVLEIMDGAFHVNRMHGRSVKGFGSKCSHTSKYYLM